MKKTIAVLAGDGIGPEIVAEAVKVLRAVAAAYGHDFIFDEQPVGGAAYDAVGDCLPDATLAACRAADAVLLGAVGGPKWDALPPAQRPERRALLTLRKELGLFTNLRPAKVWPCLKDASPLRREIVDAGVDLLVVRELTGGLYFGAHRRAADGRSAVDELPYAVDEIERIFARIWERSAGEALDSLRYARREVSQRDSTAGGGTVVSVVNREPRRSNRQIRQSYVAVLRTARNEVRIVNPYPTTTHSVRRAMKRALRRGVRMQIMVSSFSDNRIVPEVIGIQMKKMMKRGAEVYYYEGGFHHSKLLTVDGEYCSVGTANLDGRSLRYDYEVNAVIFSPEVTQTIDSIFVCDVEHSRLLTPQNFRERFSFGRRFVGRLFQPLKGLL